MKLKDEMPFEEHRARHVILEMYNAMQRAMETVKVFGTKELPGAAD